MWWIWPIYIMCLVIVVYVSTKLAKYVDLLEKKTNLSGALLGGILLAGITSLPEFVSSITGALMNEPDMTQGNILGSNLFDIAIIGALMFCYVKRIKNAKLSAGNGTFLWVCTLITAILLVCVVFKISIIIPYINVNFIAILCIALYVLSLFMSNNADQEDETEERIEAGTEETLTVKQIVRRFILCALILVGVSIAITYISDYIAEVYGLGKGLAGALFLGIATSLPEIISSFELTRLDNFNSAFSNILGSCLFNYMVISVADIFYFAGSVFRTDLQSVFLCGCLMTAFIVSYIYYLMKRKKQKQSGFTTVLFGTLISITYIAFLVLSTVFPSV